jgi:hypothetical protein
MAHKANHIYRRAEQNNPLLDDSLDEIEETGEEREGRHMEMAEIEMCEGDYQATPPSTLAEFEGIPDGKVFATGVLPNSPAGIFMTNTGGNLRWIAKKGYANDWTIYCHWDYNDVDYIEQSGDKVTSKANILKCLPNCTDILPFYRY